MSHPSSIHRSKSNSKQPRKERHLSVRSIKYDEPDLERIAKATVAMIFQQVEREQQKDSTKK